MARFICRTRDGSQEEIPDLEELGRRIRAGEIDADMELYDASTDRWARAGELALFHFLQEEDPVEDSVGGQTPEPAGGETADPVDDPAPEPPVQTPEDPAPDPLADHSDESAPPPGDLLPGHPESPGAGPPDVEPSSQEPEEFGAELDGLGAEPEKASGEEDPPGPSSTDDLDLGGVLPADVARGAPDAGFQGGREPFLDPEEFGRREPSDSSDEGASRGEGGGWDDASQWSAREEPEGPVGDWGAAGGPDTGEAGSGGPGKASGPPARPRQSAKPGPPKRASPRPPRRRRKGPVVAGAGVLAAVGVAAGVYVFGLSSDQDRQGGDGTAGVAESTAPTVAQGETLRGDPDALPEGEGVPDRLRDEEEALRALVVANLAERVDEMREAHDLGEAPPDGWLTGRYFASAGDFSGIPAYWDRYRSFVTEVEAQDSQLFGEALDAGLSESPLEDEDRQVVEASLRTAFQDAAPARHARYEELQELSDAILALHDLLEANSEDIAYTPAFGQTVVGDPVLEAVPENPELRDAVNEHLDRTLEALDRSHGVEPVSTEELMAAMFERLWGG